MTRAAPPWLEDFQARFGDVLRTPLARETGTLSATPDRYDSETVAETLEGAGMTSAERLAVYNRQYWFRLLGVLHGASGTPPTHPALPRGLPALTLKSGVPCRLLGPRAQPLRQGRHFSSTVQ